MGKLKNFKFNKQKVKTSSKTKFLPKGQNITNTSFKIKPINIITQLKETSTQRNINIPDLISKLNNTNFNRKIEACEELCHAISHNPETVRPWILLLIQGVIQHIQDRESKVRKSCINLIDTTLKTFPNKYNSIFNIMSANLRCAMTNIDKAVQEDSLLLIDSFLTHIPTLLIEDFRKIFRDFLTLTSKLKSDSTVGRTLTVNLNSKLTSVRWRIKVLSQLYGVLKIVIKNLKSTKTIDKPLELNVTNNTFYIPVYKTYKLENFTNYLDKADNEEDNHMVLTSNFNILLNLLYETWLEVVPEKSLQKAGNESTVLNKEASTILDCITNILFLFYEYSQTSRTMDSLVSSSELVLLLNNLMDNFPYTQNEKLQSTKNFKKENISSLFIMNADSKCVQQNLIICLFCCIKLDNKNRKLPLKLLSNYINKCLTVDNYMMSSNIKYLLKILNKIFEEPNLWLHKGMNLEEILQNFIQFYNSKNVNEEHKSEILCLLIRISDIPLINKYVCYKQWFRELPLLLCKGQISDKVVIKLLQLSKEKNKLFNKTLHTNLNNILDNLPKLQINSSTNVDTIKMNITYIFYYISYLLNGKDIEIIQNFINNNKDLVYSKYFINILQELSTR